MEIDRHSEDQVMARIKSKERQQYWREVMERQQASGQTIAAFCGQEGVSSASFHAWKRRLRPPHKPGQKAATPSLVPVQIVGDGVAGMGSLEVRWPGGVVLRIQTGDGQAIGAVVAALSAAARRARRC